MLEGMEMVEMVEVVEVVEVREVVEVVEVVEVWSCRGRGGSGGPGGAGGAGDGAVSTGTGRLRLQTQAEGLCGGGAQVHLKETFNKYICQKKEKHNISLSVQ